MDVAQTDGVMVKNTNMRNYLLRKNLGKYTMYDELLEPAIGEAFNTKTRKLSPMTEGKGLLHHTHESDLEYATNINWQYLNGIYNSVDVFDIDEQSEKRKRNLYSANGFDYRRYVYDVYGHEDVAIRFVNGLLATDCIEKALKMSEVGVVENVSPLESMAGTVKTNINNFSGTDTRLGLITNQLYANALYYGAQFNTARQIANGAELEDTTLNYLSNYQNTDTSTATSRIITPSSVYWYGNNTNNMNKLPFLFVRDKATGRMATDHSQEVDVIHDLKDVKNLCRTYLDEALRNKSFYSAESGDHYVDVTEVTSKDGKFVESVVINSDFDMDESLATRKYNTEGRLADPIEHVVYADRNTKNGTIPIPSNSENNEFDYFKSIRENIDKRSLLGKTNELFRQSKIMTMHGRFYNSQNADGSPDTDATFIDTAKNDIYGNSHGRNLVKRGGAVENVNGYDDPYCRVWTYHHQYDRMNKLIRPFGSETAQEELLETTRPYRSVYESDDVSNGIDYLKKNTVLRNTGLVNITPSIENNTVDVTRCMFSLENLAWKDVPNVARSLSKEQRGPNGGRIMWFPPYGLNFNETVSAQYNTDNFIGRGEPVFTYSNTVRRGNLEFIMLIDYPSVINSLHNAKGDENAPDYGDELGAGDMEGNILRYFAGCEPLKYKEKVDEEIEEAIVQEEKVESSYGYERIFVFFPNNYSGNYEKQDLTETQITSITETQNDKVEFTKKIKESYGKGDTCTDNDFYQYLLYGKNISVDLNADNDVSDASGKKVLGYEMYDGDSQNIIEDTKKYEIPVVGVKGISYTRNVIGAGEKDYNKEWCIRPCAKAKTYRTDIFRVCKTDDVIIEENNWYYRVDYDLHETVNYSSNRDLSSFGLNSKLENVQKLQTNRIEFPNGLSFSNATASFAELCCALQKNSLLSDSTNNGKWVNYSQQKCGSRKENISRLSRLLKMTDTIKEIKFVGCATRQKPERASMLAIRRELALESLMKKAIGQLGVESSVISTDFILSSYTNTGNDANNCLEAKIGKMACIEIKYDKNKYDVQLSTMPTDEDEEEMAIRSLYKELIGNSSVLANYDKHVGDCYALFKAWFKGEVDGKNNEKVEVSQEFIQQCWSNNTWTEKTTF